MLFNRLNANTYAHQITDGVCYVHKKFGVIKETKLKMQNGVTNQPKRFKVEALKSKTSDTNGPGKKAIIVGTKTETKIRNKPLDIPVLSSPPLTSRQTKVKRIEPLKGPSRPVLDDISEKPLQPMVKPRIKRKEPLKGPFRPVPLPLQQQHLSGPPMLGKYLNDVSAMPPKPLQPMVEPCIKRIEPLKGPFRPVPLPLQQPLRGPFRPVPLPLLQPLKGPFRPVPMPLLQPPLNGLFRPVPLSLPQPLNGLFRPVPLPLQQPLKEPFRSVALALRQQEISLFEKHLENIQKRRDQNFKFICNITNSEPNMTIRHLTNTTLRSANKENLIKKPKEKYVKSDSKKANTKKPSNKRKINKEQTSDSKQANAKKALNKRKYNKKTTPRLSPGVLKAKIESLSPTVVKKQKKLHQAVQASNSKQANAKKPPNKRKYNKRTIETSSQQNLEQAVQAPKNKAENNMYVCSEESKSTIVCGCIKQA
ncbi:RNA-binding protein 33-like isoform X5 [Bactrocera neohumeralis]|uniref:RNA-binding protein 33-like isoform X5 n=1 Tax=Bactrocera neohumeralis TaxID=98809 RepID=UPI0021657C48|nr:RNA-binding protein 33-like isoform X5 [Bactrocera neohumeralis]